MRRIAFFLCIVIILFSSMYAESNSIRSASAHNHALAPGFTLTDIDGNAFSLSDYLGRVVLLEFFTTTCHGSVDQTSYLKPLAEEFRGKLIILSISPENETVLREFREDNNVTWTIARDDANVFDACNVSAVPSIFIIDQQGFINFTHLGLTEESVLRLEIESLISQYEVIAVYGSSPTIDGSIDIEEWNDAEPVSFNNTKLFVKQDGRNLYIAFNVSDSTLNWNEYVAVFFDVDHNDGIMYQPDDIALGTYRNGTLMEGQLGNETYTNATGWAASVNLTSEVWQAEFNITYSKIEVTAGVEKALGVVFIAADYDFPYYFQTWPPNLMVMGPPDNPSKWGDMTSTGYNWIPEFPPLLILPLFMIITLLIVLIYGRKSSLQQHTTFVS